MGMIGRIIAFVFLILAAIALARDALNLYATGQIALLSGREFWLALGPGSYYGTENFLTINIPPLWDPVLTFVLDLPAFITTGVVGLLAWFVSRKPQPKKRPRPAN
jgi:hypothetical protein